MSNLSLGVLSMHPAIRRVGDFFALALVLAMPATAAAASAPASLNPPSSVSATPGEASTHAAIATSGTTIYVAWREVTAAGVVQVRLRKSTNNGTTFVDGPVGAVVATVAAAETVYAVRVAASGLNVYVVFTAGPSEDEAEVYYSMSTNSGALFSAPAMLTGAGGSAFADIALDGNGYVHVVTEDRGASDAIRHLRSTNGVNFDELTVAMPMTDEVLREPRIAANGTNLSVVWTNVAGGEGDVFAAHGTSPLSPDPATFDAPVALSSSPGVHSASPALAYPGALHVVWREGPALALSTSIDNGATFVLSPLSPLAAAGAGETLGDPGISAMAALIVVSWTIQDGMGVHHGPFIRRSDDGGASFAATQSLQGMGGGVPFGGVATLGSPSHFAWPGSATGFPGDAEILFTREIGCTNRWLAAVSGSYTDATKWSAGIPVAGQDVCITVDGTYTVTLTSSTRSVGTLAVSDADNTGTVTLRVDRSTITAAAEIVNAGVIELLTTSSVDAVIGLTAGAPGLFVNTPKGIIRTLAGGTGDRRLAAHVRNEGTIDAQGTIQFGLARTIVNHNIVAVAAGQTAGFEGSSTEANKGTFIQQAGTLNVGAGFTLVNDVFNFNGGDITGTIFFTTGSDLVIGPGSDGSAIFDFRGALNTLAGDVAAGQEVLLPAFTTNASVDVTWLSGFANHGLIRLSSTGGTARSALVVNGLLENYGTIELTGTDASTLRLLDADIENHGTIRVQRHSEFGATRTVTNHGDVTIDAPYLLSFDLGATSTATFTQAAGTLTIPDAAQFKLQRDIFNFNGGTIAGTVDIENDGALNIGAGSDGAGMFDIRVGNTSYSGDLGAAQTIRILGCCSNGAATMTAANDFANHGTIVLDSEHASSNAPSTLVVAPGKTLTNHGTIRISDDPALKTPPSVGASGRLLNGDVVNHGTITVTDNAEFGATRTVVNHGALTVGPGVALLFDAAAISTGTFTQAGGTLTVNGDFKLQRDVFNFNGGDIVGIVDFESGGALNIGPGSQGMGAFDIRAGDTAYSGNLAAAQTIRILGCCSNGAAAMTAAAGFTSRGLIVLDSEHASSNTPATLRVTAGTLTNEGTIQVSDDPALKTPPAPSAGGRLLDADVLNNGTILVTDNAELGAVKTMTNAGAFTIVAGVELTLDDGALSNGTFTQAEGTLTVAGKLRLQEDVFNFTGGDIVGQVLVTEGSTLNIASGSEGAGDFVFNHTGGTLTGNIAAGQVVRILGVAPNGSAAVTAPAGFINRGRLLMDSSGGTAAATFTLTNGTLENRGVFDILDTGLTGARTFVGNLTNLGAVNVLDNTTFNKPGASYINRGTFTIGAGQTLTLSGTGSPTMTNESPGTYAGGGTLFLSGGAGFGGTGTAAINVNNSVGHLRPGLSPGILNIQGNYTQAAGGTMHIEIAGSVPGLYDQLNVTGLATLAGTVNLTVLNDHCPEGTYDFMTFGSRAGTFGTFNGLNQPFGRTFVPQPMPTIYRLGVIGTPCDTTPPVITPVVTGAQGNNGWYVGDVTVTWTVTDPESAISSKNGCDQSQVTVDTAGVTFTCTATSAGGTSEASVTVTRDATPPVIVNASRSPEANVNGWNNTAVTATFSASDALSGIDGDATVEQILAGEGAAQTASHVFVDLAGNMTTAAVQGINIDMTPPSVQAVRTPPPNAHGWNNTDVTATFTGVDLLSGIADAASAAHVFSAEGAGQGGSHTFFDLAGNSATASIGGINIDKTSPTVAVTRVPAPNANGWNNTDVVVTYTAADLLSGIDGNPVATQVFSAEGANQGGSHTFADRAGNSATAVITGINIDKSAPGMVCSITPSTIWPPNGRLVPVTVTITGSDGVSQFAGFVLTSAVSDEGEGIEGFAVGTADRTGQVRARRNGNGDGRVYSLTYTGTDLAGNSATCVVTVTVPHDQRGR